MIGRHTRVPLLLVALSLLMLGACSAQPLLVSPDDSPTQPASMSAEHGGDVAPDLFLDLPMAPPPSAPVDPEDPTVIRTRVTQLNPEANIGQAPGRYPPAPPPGAPRHVLVNLNLFDDAQYQLVFEGYQPVSPQQDGLVGSLKGHPDGSAIWVTTEAGMAANIRVGHQLFYIHPIEDGLYEIQEINLSIFLDEEDPEAPEIQIDAEDDFFSSPPAMDETPVIDVMVLYTPEARASTPNIELDIQLTVAETNLGFAQSNVQPRIRLVHTAEISYTETVSVTTRALQTHLDRLVKPRDGQLDLVHALRDQYGADLVSLWVKTGSERPKGTTCGKGKIMEAVSSAFESEAFSVVVLSCARSYFSFAHELGHNFGARHDRAHDWTDGKPFSFNHGYVDVGKQRRTIMGYNVKCDKASPPAKCTRMPYWSNPDIELDGTPLGIVPAEPDAADNRLTLNRTSAVVAAFRETVVNDASGVRQVVLPAPLYYVNNAGQIMRMERDGVTTVPVTPETWIVTAFDVSPATGRLVYVVENHLLTDTPLGGNPVKLSEASSGGSLHSPLLSPDGQRVAVGVADGVEIKPAEFASERLTTIAIDPVALGFREPSAAETYTFTPLAWSSDGSRLLISAIGVEQIAYVVADQSNGNLTHLAIDNVCCQAIWPQETEHVFLASQDTTHIKPGLWRIDTESGQVSGFIDDKPVTMPRDTAHGLYAFVAEPVSYPFQYGLYRVWADAGGVELEPVVNQTFEPQAGQWAPDDSGVVITLEDDRFFGMSRLLWIPTTGQQPVELLPIEGSHPRFGTPGKG